MDNFAEVLKELVDGTGLTLRKLATLSNISANQYSEYLHGSYPTIPVALKLANYFCCSLDFLFGLSLNKGSAPTTNFSVKNFLERYNNTLKQNGTTHWKLCNEIDLTESSIRRWKKGATPYTISIIKIAKALSTSIDYLIGC